MTEWQDFIGKTMVQHDVLTAALAQRHGATLDLPVADGGALPGIHWCLCLPEAATAELGPDGHPRRDIAGSFLPPIPLPRRMWASSSVEFIAPVPVGAEVVRTSTIADIAEKTGGSGRLVFVTVEHVTRVGGTEAVREKQNIVYREAVVARAAGGAVTPPPPTPPLKGTGEEWASPIALLAGGEWPFARTLVPTEPLLLRFSALTFNAHRIHYDLPYARDEEGYPGLVVHGPLTATLLLNHATALAGQAIKRFSFRGASPAFCGEPLTLGARREGDAIALTAINGADQTVMTGEAEL